MNLWWHNRDATLQKVLVEPGGMINAPGVSADAPPIFIGTVPDLQFLEQQPMSYNYSGFFLGATSYSWNGSIPGLSFDNGSGILSGTPTVPFLHTNQVVTGTNAFGSTLTNPHSIEITDVIEPPVFAGPVPDQQGTEGAGFAHDYSQYFTGATSYSWTDNVAGLSIDTNTGIVSGTPTTPGVVPVVTITGTNAGGSTPTNAHQYTILNAPPVFSGPVPTQNYTVGAPASYNYSIHYSGVGITYTKNFTVAGMTLDPNTGVHSGTPTMSGPVLGCIVTATNEGGATPTNAHTINVDEPIPQPPVFSGPVDNYSLPVQQVASVDYSQYFSGIIDDYSENQSIPGLTLNTGTGELAGTPTIPGLTLGYIVTASNVGGSTETNAHEITVTNIPPVFSGPVPDQDFPVNQVGSHGYSQYFTGGSISYSENTSIPGMTLGTSTGTLSGTPTVPGTTSYQVTATNDGGSDSTNLHDVVVLEIPPTFIGGPVAQQDYDEGSPGSYDYAQHFTGVDLLYSENATIPGMTLNLTTGLHSGTPTTAGTTPYQVTATNNGGAAQTNLHDVVVTATVGPALVHQSTFTGANGTTIESYVPEVGSQWTNVDSQAWEIDGNAMRLASGGGAISHPNSAANQEIRFTCLREASGSATQNITARTVDANNGWFCQILATACRLRDEVGNVPTTRITVNWQRDTRLTWNMNGDLHTLTSTTASDTFTSSLYETQLSNVQYIDSTPDSNRGLDELEVSTL